MTLRDGFHCAKFDVEVEKTDGEKGQHAEDSKVSRGNANDFPNIPDEAMIVGNSRGIEEVEAMQSWE